jgi:hypothetical protein
MIRSQSRSSPAVGDTAPAQLHSNDDPKDNRTDRYIDSQLLSVPLLLSMWIAAVRHRTWHAQVARTTQGEVTAV